MDPRFHIHVASKVEHELPFIGRALRDHILDDATNVDALREFTTRHAAAPQGSPVAEEKEAFSAALEAGGGFERACVALCTHLDEHIHAIMYAWMDFLQCLQSDVRKLVHDTRRKIEHSNCVCRQYRRFNSRIVDEELRTELLSIMQTLDRDLDALRGKPLPNVLRSKELTDAFLDLKRIFSEAYGTVPTRALLAGRAAFERAVSTLERAVCVRFAAFVSTVLEEDD